MANNHLHDAINISNGVNNFLSTNPTTLNLSSLVSVCVCGGGVAAESQLTVRDTDRLSVNKRIN